MKGTSKIIVGNINTCLCGSGQIHIASTACERHFVSLCDIL